jgi:hypothetical protein
VSHVPIKILLVAESWAGYGVDVLALAVDRGLSARG